MTSGRSGRQSALPVPQHPPCPARFMPLAASKNLNHAFDTLCKRDLEAEKVKWEVESLPLKPFEMTFTSPQYFKAIVLPTSMPVTLF